MIKVVTTKGTLANSYIGGAVRLSSEQAEKRAALLNRRAEKLGIKTRYRVERS